MPALVGVKIEREKLVWEPDGKCDMWVSTEAHPLQKSDIVNVIELKAAYEIDQGGKIRQDLVEDRMKQDMEKVSVEKILRPSVYPEGEGKTVRPICIGVTNFAKNLRSSEWASDHGTW